MNLDRIYSINDDYFLHHDLFRSFIRGRKFQKNVKNPEWESIIHPYQAAIFSFFTHGKPLGDVIEEISHFVQCDFEESRQMIEPYLNNEETISTAYSGFVFKIPPKFILEGASYHKRLSPEDFAYEKLDFKTKRLFKAPSKITFMATNKCSTKCIYCYADTATKVNQMIPFDKIKEVIKQAFDEEITSIGLIGGEFFLYPHWKELINELEAYNYHEDFFSTKISLNEDDIKFLKSKNIRRLQISLDSCSPDTLKRMVNAPPDYIEKMAKSLELLSSYKIRTKIAVVITKYNSSFEQIDELLDFASKHSCIRSLEFRPAIYSLYRENVNFSTWGVSKSDYENLISHLREIKDKYKFSIACNEEAVNKDYYLTETGSCHFEGARCSANSYHMFILPDGKVTICEQLYWNKDFLVGDLNHNTISEIWNSEKSLKLANLTREDYRIESKCRECEVFANCHTNLNKCWADILKSYGVDNWDYPDPRCKYAPAMYNNIAF